MHETHPHTVTSVDIVTVEAGAGLPGVVMCIIGRPLKSGQ
jgi:16S rRNA G527 N7-methylase RsmG